MSASFSGIADALRKHHMLPNLDFAKPQGRGSRHKYSKSSLPATHKRRTGITRSLRQKTSSAILVAGFVLYFWWVNVPGAAGTRRVLHGFGNTRKSSANTRPIVAFDRGNRTLWQGPGAAEIFPHVEQIILIAATIEDQRSTWQEGSRPPYFVRALVYPQKLQDPEGYEYGPFLLRANATFGATPSAEPTRCRPYGIQSNYEPNRDVIKQHPDQAYGLRIECDLPEGMAHLGIGMPKELDITISFQAIRYNETRTRQRLADLARTHGGQFDYPSELLSRPTAAEMSFRLTELHVPYSKYTLCGQPIRNYQNFIGDQIPARIVEWRLYWDALGVKRVVWYSYREETRWITFLERFLRLFDNLDQIFVVDEITAPTKYVYHDQPMWYNHCGTNFRKATDFFIIFDFDEIIALEPKSYDAPAAAMAAYVDGWKKGTGSHCLLRQDLAMSAHTFLEAKKVDGVSLDMLAQDVWTAIKDDEATISRYLRKSIHRALAPQEIWTHYATWFYPFPVESDRPLPDNSLLDSIEWPKPYFHDRLLWETKMWHQNVSGQLNYEDLWPRAYHYRWWGIHENQVGKPLPTHVNLRAFQAALRARIMGVLQSLR